MVGGNRWTSKKKKERSAKEVKGKSVAGGTKTQGARSKRCFRKFKGKKKGGVKHKKRPKRAQKSWPEPPIDRQKIETVRDTAKDADQKNGR